MIPYGICLLWLTYLEWWSLGPSVLLQMALFHYFWRLNSIPVCVCVCVCVCVYHIFTHLSVNGHLGCFQALPVVNSTAMWFFIQQPGSRGKKGRDIQAGHCGMNRFSKEDDSGKGAAASLFSDLEGSPSVQFLLQALSRHSLPAHSVHFCPCLSLCTYWTPPPPPTPYPL